MVEKETITLGKGKDKDTFTIKKGALHRALGYSGKFTKSRLISINKTEVGGSFIFRGKTYKMTRLMKSRVTLAITLMGGK